MQTEIPPMMADDSQYFMESMELDENVDHG